MPILKGPQEEINQLRKVKQIKIKEKIFVWPFVVRVSPKQWNILIQEVFSEQYTAVSNDFHIFAA